MNNSIEQITSILVTTAIGQTFFENVTDIIGWLTPVHL